MAEKVEQQLHNAQAHGVTPGQMVMMGMGEAQQAQHYAQQAAIHNQQAAQAIQQAHQAQLQAQKANGGWKIGMIVGAVVAIGLCMAVVAVLLVLMIVPMGPS